jgi:hypothetical protein
VQVAASRAKILLWLCLQARKVDLRDASDGGGCDLLRDAWRIVYLLLIVYLVASGIQTVCALDEEIEQRLLILLGLGSSQVLALIHLRTLGLREYALSMFSFE